ncbi:shikimate dehydrogenase family protein [Limnovirga soli]|uniref:Shikimate dehydrogenase n=1 Tax=Limnovirga soli TaxID=2656915 RepID=A0A8J8FDT1_9BACT|nr:shikimate dehydrogenase [Limnovirga soli]NNV56205.1 shikimate dehydrogenase [Limnovirga soli]
MREYGLIGYPLSHSFSQKYFTEKFIREGIADAVFHAFAIPSITDLPPTLQSHPALQGFAITIPYKRAIIPYLHQAHGAVVEMDACNCVKIINGQLYGYNTDVIGFEKSFLEKRLPQHNKALVLGTGGAASAVAFVLNKLSIPFQYVSRTANISTGTLAYGDITADIMAQFNIIINCTPLGTYPQIDTAPDLPYHLLNASHYLFDLVYNPSKTKFLQLGEAQGATIKNGYDMLVLQAEENWIIWNS